MSSKRFRNNNKINNNDNNNNNKIPPSNKDIISISSSLLQYTTTTASSGPEHFRFEFNLELGRCDYYKDSYTQQENSETPTDKVIFCGTSQILFEDPEQPTMFTRSKGHAGANNKKTRGRPKKDPKLKKVHYGSSTEWASANLDQENQDAAPSTADNTTTIDNGDTNLDTSDSNSGDNEFTAAINAVEPLYSLEKIAEEITKNISLFGSPEATAKLQSLYANSKEYENRMVRI